MVEPYLGRSVLEIGSGHGSITQHLVDGRRVVATDVSEACLGLLQKRFADLPNVTVRYADVRDLDMSERFDSVVMINVLEHIYDDAGTLRLLSDRLEPGGNCVIYVPAINSLYGRYDRAVGHYRRYSKRLLRAVADEAGLRPIELRYVNLLTIPAWLVLGLGGIDCESETSMSRSLDLWDKLAIPITRGVERHVSPPIGLNLLCVLRRD